MAAHTPPACMICEKKLKRKRSRELKSVTVPPTTAQFVKLRLHSNYVNEKNIFNQVSIIAVNVLGEEVPSDWDERDFYNNNGHSDLNTNSEAHLISNPQYTSPYDDLAFEMYVDKDVAKIMRRLEWKKQEAVIDERFEYARKLKLALQELREAGETLGRYEQEKKQAICMEDYDKAKAKKIQIEEYREEIYSALRLEQLLEIERLFEENDVTSRILEPRSKRGNQSLALSPPTPDEQPSPSQSHYEETSISLQSDVWGNSYSHRLRSSEIFNNNNNNNQLCHSFSQSSFDEKPKAFAGLAMSSSTPHLSQLQCQMSPFKNLNLFTPNSSTMDVYHSLPPIETHQEPFYLNPVPGISVETQEMNSPDTPHFSKSPTRPNTLKTSSKKFNGVMKSSFEAYEEQMLPALRQFPTVAGSEIIRECQVVVEQAKKSKLNDRERKQAALPITVFGMELVEKFYSKHFADKEEGLKILQTELKAFVKSKDDPQNESTTQLSNHSPNKIARAAVLLLHRSLRDKVYSVYSCANDTIRLFFTEFVPGRVSSTEITRSVEKLLPELISKSGDVTPRIHNMAAHTLLSMAECKEIKQLHIIPVHLSRPITSSVHPRLAQSRLEMVEQLILNQGISTEKNSGLTCRTLAEFGASGLHHPAEAVRKVSERILIQVYKVNPRLVRKQLPPDDDVTRRNLLYRQLFQEFDNINCEKRKEAAQAKPKGDDDKSTTDKQANDNKKLIHISQIPKRMVNQQTSPMKPFQPSSFADITTKHKSLTTLGKIASMPKEQLNLKASYSSNGNLKITTIERDFSQRRRQNMSRISEEHLEEDDSKPQVHFPALIDRQKADGRWAHGRRSLKYIFPTSYIGTSQKSQEATKKFNDPNFCPTGQDTVLGRSQSFPSSVSGIPILKNGYSGRKSFFSSLLTMRKFGKNNHVGFQQKPTLEIENVDSSSSSTTVTTPNTEGNKMQKRICIFCSAQEDWLTDENLNLHYWKSCPMLTRCSLCKEVVEISGLTQHQLDECEHKVRYKKCDNCKEAIFKENFETHDCKVCSAIRCPLCHEDLPDENNWKEHLMGPNPCVKNIKS